MTDDLYTKQCDTPLIQDGWVAKIGDLTDKGLVICCFEYGIKTNHVNTQDQTFVKGDLIFKPSQAQLQGMLLEKTEWRLRKKWIYGPGGALMGYMGSHYY